MLYDRHLNWHGAVCCDEGYAIGDRVIIDDEDGSVMPSWFDIHEIPITANSPVDESSLLKAVQNVHSMIDKEVAAGVDPKNVR
ncbi:probable carboxylesterase SOBER1-like protein [Tanacetum coccineum]